MVFCFLVVFLIPRLFYLRLDNVKPSPSPSPIATDHDNTIAIPSGRATDTRQSAISLGSIFRPLPFPSNSQTQVTTYTTVARPGPVAASPGVGASGSKRDLVQEACWSRLVAGAGVTGAGPRVAGVAGVAWTRARVPRVARAGARVAGLAGVTRAGARVGLARVAWAGARVTGAGARVSESDERHLLVEDSEA
jgi:hypothetical protein